MINNGMCARYHDRARLDFDSRGRAGISVFEGQPYTLPHHLDMMERHPLGSQAFLPMSNVQYLVVIANDDHGIPARPRAFIAGPEQGVNIHRGVWHGVLTPFGSVARFAVVDWIGDLSNLQEHRFDAPWLIGKAN